MSYYHKDYCYDCCCKPCCCRTVKRVRKKRPRTRPSSILPLLAGVLVLFAARNVQGINRNINIIKLNSDEEYDYECDYDCKCDC